VAAHNHANTRMLSELRRESGPFELPLLIVNDLAVGVALTVEWNVQDREWDYEMTDIEVNK
jgi:hypothetical protein